MGLCQTHSQVSAQLDKAMRWDFEASHPSEIATIWADLSQRQPSIFNGPVLMSYAVSGGEHSLQVKLLRTSYAAFMAWRELDFPSNSAKLCFPIAALKTADGYFLLGTMAAHTSNAGLSYFPSGTLNDEDVLPDGSVALQRSLAREVEEETGLSGADYDLAEGWTRIENAARCAFFKEARLKASRAEIAQRIATFLAGQVDAELVGVVFVKIPADLLGLKLPAVQREYFEQVFGNG